MISLGERRKSWKAKKTSKQPTGTFLQTFTCHLKNPNTKSTIEVRGLLDPGSLRSYLDDRICKYLKLDMKDRIPLMCYRFGSSESYDLDTYSIDVELINEQSKSRLCSFTSSPCITGNFRTCPGSDFVNESLPKNISYADPDIFQSAQRPIEILIGADLYNEFVNVNHNQKLFNGLILLKSFFGWVPSGSFSTNETQTSTLLNFSEQCDESKDEKIIVTQETSDSDLLSFTDLTRLWSLEMIGIKLSEIDNDYDKVLQHFRKTARILNGRYMVCWPWRLLNPNLASNYRVAKARLRSLLNSLNLDHLKEYNEIFLDYLAKGIIELAPVKTNNLTHYLCHRGRLQKGKIRIVFDASAKTKSGFSLNDLIFKGPKLQEDIVKLLINFRLHAIGLTSDIEKAFLQINLNEIDRDCVRFLWIKDLTKPPEGDNLAYYRFARVPFGVNASPFLLNMVLQEHLSSSPSNDWHKFGQDKFYVDNLVASVKDVNSAIQLFQSLTSKLKDIGMNLRDWTSNNNEFVKALPSHLTDSKEIISILGLVWNKLDDSISVKISKLDSPTLATKSNILSFLASIYDPLGFFGPCTLKLKIFLQSCWKNKYEWKETLPSHLTTEWMKIRSALTDIPSIKIPRRYWKFTEDGEYRLHVFCDASKFAFACCAYLTYFNSKTCESGSYLIMSKVRTAPINPLSIPRLELLALLIGKRVAVFLRDNISITLTEVILWTDATTVIHWLNTTSVLPQFVFNRIAEIKRTREIQVRHISGKQNPSDVASRGEFPKELQKLNLWWYGPGWLTCPALWPSNPPNLETFETSNLETTATFLIGNNTSSLLTEGIENNFSTWHQRIRIFIHVIKFTLSKLRNPRTLTDHELFTMAERILIRELQKKYLGKEYSTALKIKTDYLDKNLIPPKYLHSQSKLDFFLDSNLLLRCKGRLENAAFPWDTIHPIILPRESFITRCYIRQLHIENLHIGCSHLLAKLRERFWVIKGRALVKSVIHQCVGCKRWTGGTYQLPPMPALPLQRVQEASPFLNVGIDYIGPLYISNNTSTHQRIYIVIFVCLVTRAIHLELARDTTAIEFLRTLIRFVSIRGSPKFILTDNATNFVFIQPFVGDKVNISDPNLKNYSDKNRIDWKFIPHCSPWQGGAYERLVTLVKLCFKKSYGNLLLDYVEMSTVICRIMDTINSRPLTYISSDEILSPLTPNNFLRLRTSEANTDINICNPRTDTSAKKLMKLWERVNTTVENFWQVFKSMYLKSLRETHVAIHNHTHRSVPFTPKIGDIVLIKDNKIPRAHWRFGKILSLDSRNAVATIQCHKSKLNRSINFLCPLELSMSN